jgi:hypothetical protein
MKDPFCISDYYHLYPAVVSFPMFHFFFYLFWFKAHLWACTVLDCNPYLFYLRTIWNQFVMLYACYLIVHFQTYLCTDVFIISYMSMQVMMWTLLISIEILSMCLLVSRKGTNMMCLNMPPMDQLWNQALWLWTHSIIICSYFNIFVVILFHMYGENSCNYFTSLNNGTVNQTQGQEW